jgi:hypothetical protein
MLETLHGSPKRVAAWNFAKNRIAKLKSLIVDPCLFEACGNFRAPPLEKRAQKSGLNIWQYQIFTYF